MTARRSAFMGLLVLALTAPLAVEAQQGRVYRVGVVLQGGAYSQAVDGLRDGLRELELEEGKQFVLQVPGGLLRGQDSKGYEARRPADRAAHEIRPRDQPEDRQSPRPHHPAVRAPPSGSGH
jgi:hypothetical protein